MVDSFSDRPERRPARQVPQRPSDPLDQRLDRWMSAGRQLVDGVSGARPGSRAGARARPGAGRSSGRPSFEGLGRWMEDRLDWLLEDEDDWREPWQQERMADRRSGAPDPVRDPAPGLERPSPWEASAPPAAPGCSAPVGSVPATTRSAANPRRPLEAMSRRQSRRLEAMDGDWPEPEDFQVSRWQRPAGSESSPTTTGPAERTLTASRPEPRSESQPDLENGRGSARPLPRSSRRRA